MIVDSTWYSFVRKMLVLCVLVGCLFLSRTSKVQACEDFFACENTADQNWWTCRLVCQGYPTPDIYTCQDACDSAYVAALDWCATNACV